MERVVNINGVYQIKIKNTSIITKQNTIINLTHYDNHLQNIKKAMSQLRVAWGASAPHANML